MTMAQQARVPLAEVQARQPPIPAAMMELIEVRDWRWRLVQRGIDGAAYKHHENGLAVITSLEHHAITKFEAHPQWWLHVSVSRAKRIPSYKDMQLVLEVFGKGRGGLQVFPKRDEHVNIMTYCLHWWIPLEQWPLPDFTQGTGSI